VAPHQGQLRLLLDQQLVHLLLLGLRRRRLGGLGTEAFDETVQLGDLLRARRQLRLQAALTLHALAQKKLPAPRVRVQPAAAHLHDAVARALDERGVMRHHHRGGGGGARVAPELRQVA